jgi:hypothetical protein
VVPLGEEPARCGARGVVLAWRGDSAELRAVLAERARAGKATRVLVLTQASRDALRSRYSGDDGVVVEALADLLTVRDGRITAAPPLGLVGGVPLAGVAANDAPALAGLDVHPRVRSAALDGLPEVKRWGEVTLFDVDESDLLGVALGIARPRRLSCVDLGLASKDGRRPVKAFALLKTICEGNGLFVTRAFGSRSNGKRLISNLRDALQATFGLDDDPFERYSTTDHAWRPKFRALADTPAAVEAAMRELGVPSLERPESAM